MQPLLNGANDAVTGLLDGLPVAAFPSPSPCSFGVGVGVIRAVYAVALFPATKSGLVATLSANSRDRVKIWVTAPWSRPCQP